jgi:hypothetical protein
MELDNAGDGGAPFTRVAPMNGPAAQPRWVRTTTSDGISITCHENDVPAFVGAALDHLYGSLYSSLKRWRVYGSVANASTCVVRRNGEILSVWLFTREKNIVRVLNEGIHISTKEVDCFANHIFGMYPAVDVIAFHAVDSPIDRLAFPYQHFNCLEDIVLTLPPTVDQYRSMLGKATRSYTTRYMNKLRRSFPTLQHGVETGMEIREEQIRGIIALHRMRMTEKGKATDIDEEETLRIIQCAKESGMISTMTLHGRILAGTINFTVGRNCFLAIIGHDPAYNDYRLGTLCCYLTICACIERGYGEYHFLWGENDYKYRLLGVQRRLDDLVVYRSRAALLSNADRVLRNFYMDRLRRAQLYLRHQLRKDGFLARLAGRVLRLLRGR